MLFALVFYTFLSIYKNFLFRLLQNSNLISDYETHLRTYQDCIHLQEVNGIINDLKIILEEENKYKTANTSIELLNYIMEYGKSGTYFIAALSDLDNYFNSIGFVQFSTSNGELYFDIFENDTSKIPEVGDLIFAKGQCGQDADQELLGQSPL